MEVTKQYTFIWFGAMYVTKPYNFIGSVITKPCKFIGFGDIHGPKPYTFIGL